MNIMCKDHKKVENVNGFLQDYAKMTLKVKHFYYCGLNLFLTDKAQ